MLEGDGHHAKYSLKTVLPVRFLSPERLSLSSQRPWSLYGEQRCPDTMLHAACPAPTSGAMGLGSASSLSGADRGKAVSLGPGHTWELQVDSALQMF